MVKEKLNKLRIMMLENGIDIYYIPTDDFHASEYVGEYFKSRQFISGFTGSAGKVLVTADEAFLWTDGRYFLQAEKELRDSSIQLMKMGEKGVPTIEEFLEKRLKSGGCLGFDGRVVATSFIENLLKNLKDVDIKYDRDFIDDIWNNRPPLSKEEAYLLDEKYSGESSESKIKKIREEMSKEGADYHVITSLDDIAWILNIRGNDVLCNPVVLSYLVISMDKIFFFANKEALLKVKPDNVEIRDYEDVYSFVKNLDKNSKILLDKDTVNYAIYKNIPQDALIINKVNPSTYLKAVKNPIEVKNMKEAHIKDGVAVTKLMHYIKINAGITEMSELSLVDVLESYRKEQKNYLGPSFEPIVSWGDHGAIVHYSPDEKSNATLTTGSFLLADTGGQYLEGTTDITRTIAVGSVSKKMKRDFTLVLCGNLELAAAKFKYGCVGANLDYLARGPLWEYGMDYNHGTGHGVGYLLNVHEGPNSFRWKVTKDTKHCVFEEGMITSDEPGLYITGEYGIRCENLMVCKTTGENEYGKFMEFETLTMVPFDLDAVDTAYMTDRQVALLNDYHKKVYENISPYLNEEEKDWLKEATRPIEK
ncbi:Xaa-Pro aminopeptidase [Acetitomaculum ruminis DSM 5522]|uniref:Xaa-Pro aminopeptidase n=1 Tax=Acetitomaculum ruminis DSM 5522 TaxID=1120918 RepID=A0A1I0UZS3_9FIRM|nr:aminopeptidase P family protein [Acetitomaculum ruminis]SFA69589.1 Xaa-Pro aminopeptidase [Acetitomaculum ruminis DSM 5522]